MFNIEFGNGPSSQSNSFQQHSLPNIWMGQQDHTGYDLFEFAFPDIGYSTGSGYSNEYSQDMFIAEPSNPLSEQPQPPTYPALDWHRLQSWYESFHLGLRDSLRYEGYHWSPWVVWYLPSLILYRHVGCQGQGPVSESTPTLCSGSIG